MTNTHILKSLLYSMLRIRAVEEAIAERYSEGKMRCPTHLSIGQEAAGAALGLALNSNDFVVSSHRAHAHYLGKGGDLPAMLAELYGKQAGCSRGRGGSMHLTDPSVGFMGSTAIVANSIPVGVGLALSAVLQSSAQVSCCCFGDGAVEEGSFYESANFAVVKNLPAIFLCENNLYSVYSPLRVRQPQGRQIYKLAESIGLHSQQIDGNDAEATLTAMQQAAVAARQGKGPVLIELMTYRWREHCGPHFDNQLGYRSNQEFADWKARDPIARLKKRLLLNTADQTEFEGNRRAIDAEVAAAFEFAESAEFPPVQSRADNVYAEEREQ